MKIFIDIFYINSLPVMLILIVKLVTWKRRLLTILVLFAVVFLVFIY